MLMLMVTVVFVAYVTASCTFDYMFHVKWSSIFFSLFQANNNNDRNTYILVHTRTFD